MGGLRAWRDDAMLSGSVFLMGATATTAALSFGFWIVAARLYSPVEVGVATSLISAASLIAYFSLLGLNSTLVRFPAGALRNTQITQSILIVAVAAAVIGSLYLAGLPLYGPKLQFVRANPVLFLVFVGFCVFSAINLLTDAVFLGEGIPQYNILVDGFVQGLTKLALPPVLVVFGAYGIFGAVGGGSAAAVLASIILLRRRAGFRFNLVRRRTQLRERVGFSVASYISSALNLAPVMVLPLIVLQRLGAVAAGSFYLAFQIASLLNAVSYAVGEAVFASGSRDESQFVKLLRRSAALLAVVQLAAAAVVAVLSGPLLDLFGRVYATQARDLLLVFCTGAGAVALNTWASFGLKLTQRMGHLIMSNVVYMVVTVGLTIAWVPGGLTRLGWAWGIGNLASGGYAAAALLSGLRSRSPGGRLPAGATDRSTRSLKRGADSMRVVVINAYVRENAGDAALLSVCLRHIREAFPDAEPVIAGMEHPTAHAAFETVPNLGSIRRYVAEGTVSRGRRILRRVTVGLWCTAMILLPRTVAGWLRPLLPAEVRGEIDAIAGADLVVSMGGGYLNARAGLDGYQNVFFVLLPALFAQRWGVPVVFAPQSFGPFPAAAQRWLVRVVLRRAVLVLAREDVSVDELVRCGVPAGRIRRAVDAGFAFHAENGRTWRGRLGLSESTNVVGVTARRWLPAAAQERYERALARTIDELQNSGRRVLLIPQVTSDYLGDDDRIVERRIAAYCATTPIQIDGRADHRDLKGLYEVCGTLIGTRFHSVIFALTGGTPCVAIEYEHKTGGIMADLGLTEWVLPMAEVTYERLWPMVRRLDTEREAYLSRLRQRLPDYRAEAERFPQLLREAVPVRAGRVALEYVEGEQ